MFADVFDNEIINASDVTLQVSPSRVADEPF